MRASAVSAPPRGGAPRARQPGPGPGGVGPVGGYDPSASWSSSPHDRRIEDADDAHVGRRAHDVPIGGPDDVEGAGLQRPAPPGGDFLELATALEDVVGLPVVLVPEPGLGSRLLAELGEREADAVRGGQEAGGPDGSTRDHQLVARGPDVGEGRTNSRSASRAQLRPPEVRRSVGPGGRDGALPRSSWSRRRTKYQMREKMFSIGDDYWIEDERR